MLGHRSDLLRWHNGESLRWHNGERLRLREDEGLRVIAGDVVEVHAIGDDALSAIANRSRLESFSEERGGWLWDTIEGV